MADDLNALLERASGGGSLPAPMVVNPLAAVNSGVQAAHNMLTFQKLQSERAAGQAFLDSIKDGHPDQAALLTNLKNNPASAFSAQTSAQAGQTLDTGTYDLHNKRLTSAMSGMGQLIADNPNGVPGAAARAFVDNRLQLGLITPEQAQALHASISDDPVKNTQLVLQGMAGNLSGQTALNAARPSTGTVETGQGMQGYQTPPVLTSAPGSAGAVAPVGGAITTGLPSISKMLEQVNQPADAETARQLGIPVGTEITLPLVQRWISQGAGPLMRGAIPGAPVVPPGGATPPPPPPPGTSVRPATTGGPAPVVTPPVPPATPAPAPSAFRPVVTALPPGSGATTEAGVKMANDLVTRADQVPTNKANYANMLADLDRIGGMPAGGEKQVAIETFLRKATGYGITMTADQVAAGNSFSKLANIAVGQQLAAIGGTDARQALFMGSNPNLDLSKLGNEQIIHMLQGNEDAIKAKGSAWRQWVDSGKGPGTYQQFQDDFNHHFDPRVFQSQYMSPSEKAAFRASLEKNPGEYAKFKEDAVYARRQGWIQ